MDVLYFTISSVFCLAVPSFTALMGYFLVRGLPPGLAPYLGYSSARSRRNEETREFADRYTGRTMRIVGLIMLAAAAVLIAAAASGTVPAEILSWLLIIELAVGAASVLPTEMALMRRYG